MFCQVIIYLAQLPFHVTYYSFWLVHAHSITYTEHFCGELWSYYINKISLLYFKPYRGFKQCVADNVRQKPLPTLSRFPIVGINAFEVHAYCLITILLAKLESGINLNSQVPIGMFANGFHSDGTVLLVTSIPMFAFNSLSISINYEVDGINHWLYLLETILII